ncbi:Leucine-rich repeat-containing protein 3 [Holothuria leucospilota]|uniref:Leucine-rich repeat-containing protein 3 n=1 Tax=Holothuria leucospilota TaxID=206669 RepID=A0A9Q1CP93_HOLLE|nr:Leucine-rich repeat-containing protein 3 [Holothuria leucospilota]
MRTSGVFCWFIGILMMCPSPTENNLDPCTPCKCTFYYGGVNVNCSNRLLYEIPENIPPNATILDLGINRLTQIPEKIFSKNAMLSTIFLHGNNIQSLGDDVFAGTKIQYM